MLTGWALDHDVKLGHFSVTQPTLEDIYLELTGATRAQFTDSRRRPYEHFGSP